MTKLYQKPCLSICIFSNKPLHPVLKQAFYNIPQSLQRDAWWLVEKADFFEQDTTIHPVTSAQEKPHL